MTVESERLTLTIDAGAVPLPVPADGTADVRMRVRALLVAVRAAHPDEPLTSLELQAQAGPGAHVSP